MGSHLHRGTGHSPGRVVGDDTNGQTSDFHWCEHRPGCKWAHRRTWWSRKHAGTVARDRCGQACRHGGVELSRTEWPVGREHPIPMPPFHQGILRHLHLLCERSEQSECRCATAHAPFPPPRGTRRPQTPPRTRLPRFTRSKASSESWARTQGTWMSLRALASLREVCLSTAIHAFSLDTPLPGGGTPSDGQIRTGSMPLVSAPGARFPTALPKRASAGIISAVREAVLARSGESGPARHPDVRLSGAGGTS